MSTQPKAASLVQLDRQLQNLVTELGAFDYTTINDKKDPGLFEGYAGLSLFYYNLYCYSKEEDHYRQSFLYLEQAYEGLDFSNLNFSYGSSGIMWLLHYYKQTQAFDMDYDDFLLQYDRSVGKYIHNYQANLDPMHGLLSIGNYLLHRPNDYTRASLLQILDALDSKKKKDGNRTWWENDAVTPGDTSEIHVNFGYAHGIPAILAFLSKMVVANVDPSRARALFDSTLRFFLGHKLEKDRTFFPSHVQEQTIKKNHRVAFCYGDLGIACGLTLAGRNMHNKRLEELAARMAINIAHISLTEEKTALHDIGLCHGAAGNGYMFLKLYKRFRYKILREAALKQYTDLFTFKKKEGGVAGFFSIDYDRTLEKYVEKADPGFINGTAGVGLSALSYLNYDKNNTWDSILYLS